MRIRTTLTAALGALALIVAVPGSASAALGEFSYRYVNQLGVTVPGALLDPVSGECINVPELLADSDAHSPHNLTNSTATVFLDKDCDGDVYYTMAPGKRLGERLHFRSVIFS
ncbi:hypothetical protein ABZW32_23385 [Streptomyces sp. NPDC004667]|uniref:hypothetical protein n=1 Tax=Streptomyces sp. NPDC004667 TaxID=3154285 RepID=UPI0033AE57EC